jgi:hypothetical protein
MKHSTSDLLQIIRNFYPDNMWPDEPGYDETEEARRHLEVTRQAGTGADYERWNSMVSRLRARFPGHIQNTSLHLMAVWRGCTCYEGLYSLLNTDEAKRSIYLAVSFLAPYYLVYSWRWTRAGNRFEVRFDLDETERPYALKIAEEIEATYGYEPMPPDVGNVLVAEVEILGARYHYFGKGTIYDYLFTINW